MRLLRHMGFIEHIFPESVKLNWDHPNGIMRSGQARNIASMSLAPYLRDNDPDQLYTNLKNAEFPEDLVDEINLLVRLFNPKLIDMDAIKKARKATAQPVTEFDNLLKVKYLLKQTPNLPSSLIVRFAQHYGLPPGIQNGPLYIAAMIKYPMKRIRAGFLGTDGRPLVQDGSKVTTGKWHDPHTLDQDTLAGNEYSGKQLYAVQQSPEDSRVRPQPHEPEAKGSASKFKKQYVPSREEMLKQSQATRKKNTERQPHWTQQPMESVLRLLAQHTEPLSDGWVSLKTIL